MTSKFVNHVTKR